MTPNPMTPNVSTSEMLLKILRHPIIKIVLMVLGFFASLNWVRSMSTAFNFYARQVLGPLPLYQGLIRIGALPVLAICILLLVLGVWHTRKQSALHKLDISLISVLGICLVAFCVSMIFRRSWSVFVMLLVPLAVYCFVMFVLVQVVVRIRDKTLAHTSYWWKFFSLPHVPPKVAMGILLAILTSLLATEVLGALGLLTENSALIGASLLVRFGWWVTMSSHLVLFSCIAISFCALNYFAAFVLGLSGEYDAANTEKILSERFKAELITNVSHDIRTPLTSIINYTNLLKTQPLAGDAATYVDVLDKKASRLKQLLSDLIDASQASTGAVKMDIQALNLSELLGQVAGEVSDSFDERDLTLVMRQPLEDAPLHVLADSRHLFRAMENIFANAAKYALPGTRVFAEIETAGADVVLTLRNTSQSHIDVPAEALTEQFIRGDLARHSEGSGLGLHIAKSLVELMGGQLVISLRGDLFEVMIMLARV